MFAKLKRLFYNRDLHKRLHAERTTSPVSLATARKVGIAFDASEPGNYVAVSHYAAKLKDMGKRVELLGYYRHRHIDGQPVFPYFNKKELNWFGLPKSGAADHFMNAPFDILINAYTEECLPLEYISVRSRSKLRVGLYNDEKLYFSDVLIKPHERPSIDQLIQDVDHYLQMIKVNAN